MERSSRTLLLQLLRILNLKCGDTPLSLSSWCGVSIPVTVRPSRTAMHLQRFAGGAGGLSVRRFREGPSKCQDPNTLVTKQDFHPADAVISARVQPKTSAGYIFKSWTQAEA